MKAERAEPKQEFVSVIVTLESQKEVDVFYAIIDYTRIISLFPTVRGWQNKLQHYRSHKYQELWKRLDDMIGQ